MRPPIFLPGKDNVIVGGPHQLIVGHNISEDTALTFVGAPDFTPDSGFHISESNRPGPAAAPWAKRKSLARGGNTNECYLLAVARPDGFRVSIDARVEIADAFRCQFVNADVAMIAAVVE